MLKTPLCCYSSKSNDLTALLFLLCEKFEMRLLRTRKNSTGFVANNDQGQIVTNIGYYLGLLVANLNDSLIIPPIPNPLHTFRTDHGKISPYSGTALKFQQEHRFLWSPRGG